MATSTLFFKFTLVVVLLTGIQSLKTGTGKLSDEVTENEEKNVPDLAKDVQELKKAVADLLNSLSSTKQSYPFVPRSCREVYLEFPFSSSGRYIIDPDGLAGDPPISVHCNMESGTTIISHDSEDVTAASRHITYNATLRQIEALIRRSKSCQQRIKINCRSFPLTINRHPQVLWLSRSSSPQYFWAGSNSSVRTCQCGIDKSCINSTVNCNCDAGKSENVVDEGYITDMETLPVMEVHLGSIEEPSYVSYKLGKLKCSGHADVKIVPESCSDLWAIGHNWNGIFLVKKSGALQSVFCDFSKLPGEEGIETQIATVDAKTSPVYFNVERNTPFNSVDSFIPFDVESLNLGKAMDIRSGIFTAPTSGIYYFSFSSMTWGRESSSLFRILLNDYTTGFSSFSWSSTIYMKRGDQLKLMLVDGNILDNNDVPFYFTGMLLQEDLIP